MNGPVLHATNPDGSKNAGFDDALGDLLTSKSDAGRVFARGLAAGLTEVTVNWVSAEVERKTEPGLIISALMEIHIQQLASVTGNFVTAAGSDVVLEHYHRTLDAQFSGHAQAIRSMLAEAHAKPNTEQTGQSPRPV